MAKMSIAEALRQAIREEMQRDPRVILIGEDIAIEVLEIGPGRVKLGIKAPREVAVLRGEIRLTGETNQLAAREVALPVIESLIERLRARGVCDEK